MKGFLFTAVFFLWFVPVVKAGTILFLVAELPGEELHNESYVVPLNNPADISYARRLINEAQASARSLSMPTLLQGLMALTETTWHPEDQNGRGTSVSSSALQTLRRKFSMVSRAKSKKIWRARSIIRTGKSVSGFRIRQTINCRIMSVSFEGVFHIFRSP